MQSLHAVVDELRKSNSVEQTIESELNSLLKKLPVEMIGKGTDIDLHNPLWVEQVIESASADLVDRLQREEVGQ